mgnify:CR=1 FL=1
MPKERLPKIEVWDVEKLILWDKNFREALPEDLERLIRQIQRLGQYKPLIITPEGIVLGGNHRLQALRRLGQTKVSVSVVFPQNEAEMREYNLSDNDMVAAYMPVELLASLKEVPISGSGDYKVPVGDSMPISVLIAEGASNLSSPVDMTGFNSSSKNQGKGFIYEMVFADKEQRDRFTKCMTAIKVQHPELTLAEAFLWELENK